MKPKPFVELNHFTVPCMMLSLIFPISSFSDVRVHLKCPVTGDHASCTQQFKPAYSWQAVLAQPAASRGQHDSPVVRSTRRSDKRACEPRFQVGDSVRKPS